MLKRLVALFVLAASATSLQGGVWDKIKTTFTSSNKQKTPTIKVLVLHDQDSAHMDVTGNYVIHDPFTNTRLVSSLGEKSQKVESVPSGLKWGEEFPGVYQLHVVPDEEKTITYINGVPYKGSFYVYDIGGSISVVNEVDVEDFLYSVLPSRYDENMAEEALAALAIAERTHACYTAQSSSNPYWHVQASDVGYKGYIAPKMNQSLASAVHSTRFMVLSRTGVYEGSITPFPIAVQSTLKPSELAALADKGENAAKILFKKFPDTTIGLINQSGNRMEHVAEISAPGQGAPQLR